MLPHGQGGGSLSSPAPAMTRANAQKSALRAAIDRLRRGLSPAEIARRSLAAQAKLLSLPPIAAAPRGATLALYLPLPGELDTEPIWEALAARGFRCAFPRVERESPRLHFYALAPGEAVERGPLGVRQPPAREELPLEAIDLFLVPGQAFDLQGGRLGRGKGYYDATLAEAPRAERIGLGFEEQVIPTVPMLPHDVPLDWIVTPERAQRCAPGRSRTAAHGPW